MESFIFAINAVLPIVLMVALGYFLKRKGWIGDGMAKSLNRLVFHYFLPVMLFLNIYKIEAPGDIRLGYIGYVAAATVLIFGISIPLVMAVTRRQESRGALLQAIFRSNFALIGIPLAESLFGEEGAMVATLLSAALIPLLNVLAVISLSVFRSDGGRPKLKEILLDVLKNPLIQSIALGVLVLGLRAVLERYGIVFRLTDIKPVYKVLESLSTLATPLALLVLGAQFEFSAVKGLRREILFGALMRTVLVPLFAIGIAYLFFRDAFTGAHFATFVAAFATPVAVSTVPMAQEMKGDAVLAGQLVVWTTLISGVTVFLIAFILRLMGVFG